MANRANNTPPINATGVYEVALPYAVTAGSIYRCESIEGFEALEAEGIDVYAKYYEPVGIANQQYLDDKVNGINIITLISDTEGVLVIPSSYISAFPTSTNVPYSRIVLSADIGILPDGLDLTAAKEAIAEAVSEIVGMGTTVDINKISVVGGISFSEHEQLELNRLDNVTERKTALAALREQAIVETKLRQRITALSQIILEQKAIIDALP